MSREKMAVEPSNATPYGYYSEAVEDEISLQELFAAVWKTRVIWVASILLVSVVFWGYWIAKLLIVPNVEGFSLPLTFAFENVEKGQYPNGAEFSRTDLIATSNLEKVYKNNQLNQFGMRFEEFVRAVQVAPYAPDELLVRSKYERLIADNKKISPQELDALRQEQQKEFSQIYARGAKITYSQQGEVLLPELVIVKLLRDIASIWAEKAIYERGVLQNDIQMFSESIIQKELIEGMDYPVALRYLKEKVELIQQNLDRLSELPNGHLVKDPDTGLSIVDMRRTLKDQLGYRLRMIEDPIQQLGISKAPQMTRLHYEEELFRLMEQKRTLQSKAAAVQSAQQEYQQQQNVSMASTVEGEVIQGVSSTTIPQFGDSFLDRIIGLSDHASDTAYRQKLSDQRIKYESEAIELEQELRGLQRNITQLDRVMGLGMDADTDVPYIREGVQAQALSELERGIPELVGTLHSYIFSMERIYQLLNQQTIYGTGELYHLASSNVLKSGGGLQLPQRIWLMYVLLLVLTTFVIVPVAMIRNKMGSASNQNG